jgi:hypothetical protein
VDGLSFETKGKAAHTEASEALARAKYERDRDEVLLGRAIEADAFARLARYERGLERTLHKALDELRYIQDKRQNRPSSPILEAISLNTEGTE